METVHKEYGTILLKGCRWNSQKADVQFSVPTGQLKSNVHGKLSIHYAADLETVETFAELFLQTSSVFSEPSRRCVKNLKCFHERTGRPVVMVQSSSSLVLSVIKTEVLSDCDDLVKQNLLLQQFGERIEKLSQQDKIKQNMYGCRISECC